MNIGSRLRSQIKLKKNGIPYARKIRCMYYIFDEYCDCLKAQINAETTLSN